MSECLRPFHEGQFPTVEWLFLDLNSYFSSVEQHLVYFGGLHGLGMRRLGGFPSSASPISATSANRPRIVAIVCLY